MSDFINIVLDMGYDYGASGGPDAFDTQLVIVGSSEIAMQRRSRPMGEWQLGSREIMKAKKDYLLDFWHTVRGQAHTFAFKDWADFSALHEPLVLNGSATTQLIKTFGGMGNDFVADITLPKPAGLVVELSEDGDIWMPQVSGTDFNLAPTTGILTWLGDPPSAELFARWSGEYYKRVRFGVARFTLQFLGYEDRGERHEAVYSLGALTVREALL